MEILITLFILGVIGLILLWAVFQFVRFIPNNRIGLVEKRWSGKGSVKSGLIA